MDGPKALTAEFGKLVGYTVTSVPAGRQVVVDGSTYTTPKVFNWLPGTDHTIGVTSPQPGVSGTRYLYQGWSDQGAQSHTVTAPQTAATYTVTFGTQHAVTGAVNPSGAGTLTLSPAAMEVEGGRSWYAVNQAVTATTAPVNASYAFASWTGGPVTAAAGAGAGRSGRDAGDERAEVADGELQCGVYGDDGSRGVVGDGGQCDVHNAEDVWLGAGVGHWVYVFSPSRRRRGRRGRVMSIRAGVTGRRQFHWVTMPQTSTTYTATFGKQYSLTTASNPAVGGSVTPAGVSWWNAGATTRGDGDGECGVPVYGLERGVVHRRTNPAPGIVMDGPKALTAEFGKLVGYTVTSVPSGRQVLVDGSDVHDAEGVQLASGDGAYDRGDVSAAGCDGDAVSVSGLE